MARLFSAALAIIKGEPEQCYQQQMAQHFNSVLNPSLPAAWKHTGITTHYSTRFKGKAKSVVNKLDVVTTGHISKVLSMYLIIPILPLQHELRVM